jgi:hypothetical protein
MQMPDAQVLPAQVKDRARILSSIRIALGASATSEAIAAEYGSIARTYTQAGSSNQAAMLELFAERLLEYDAGVYYAPVGNC